MFPRPWLGVFALLLGGAACTRANPIYCAADTDCESYETCDLRLSACTVKQDAAEFERPGDSKQDVKLFPEAPAEPTDGPVDTTDRPVNLADRPPDKADVPPEPADGPVSESTGDGEAGG